MKDIFSVLIVTAFLLSAPAIVTVARGDDRHYDSRGETAVGGAHIVAVAVPTPFTFYAAGSGLALLAGAGWYIRRRK